MELRYLNDLEVFVEVGRAPTDVASEMLNDEVTRDAVMRLVKRLGFHLIKTTGVMTTAGANLFRKAYPALSVLKNVFDGGVKVERTPPMYAMSAVHFARLNGHKTALLGVDGHWESGDVVVWIRIGPSRAQAAIKGVATSRVDWRCTQPSAPSSSISEVRGPVRSNTTSRIEIEMQNGDTLILEAREFEFGTWQ